MFHSSLSNLYNNVIIYKIKKSRENSFVCERNVQNFPIHVIRALYIDVSLYLTLTIQASSRLKRSANHLWNNSDVCRKKFGEWYPIYLKGIRYSTACPFTLCRGFFTPKIVGTFYMQGYKVKEETAILSGHPAVARADNYFTEYRMLFSRRHSNERDIFRGNCIDVIKSPIA